MQLVAARFHFLITVVLAVATLRRRSAESPERFANQLRTGRHTDSSPRGGRSNTRPLAAAAVALELPQLGLARQFG